MMPIRSLLAILLIAAVLVAFRATHPGAPGKPLVVTTWDAFGYYAYLPAIGLHGEVKELKWIPAADSQYQLTGGQLYQANKVENGNHVFKYLGGVALLQAPLFALAHLIATHTGYPPDGFSAPYQHAIAWGALLYCLLGLLVLRKVLLHYFSDAVTAATLLVVALATNLIQYTAVDGAMSHVWIFPLYALQLWATRRWHQRPHRALALLIGYLTGLATICRPTEAVMLFIPLLWCTHNRAAARAKWAQVRAHRGHLALAIAGGIIGVLPQLIYWKVTTGAFIYDVGSKWAFLNPHFRVLFGWEKGWFIYTPAALLMVAGLFFVRKYPFRNALIVFSLLNIWVVVAWDDWRYGGSYSTRALVQSYPVMALGLAAFFAALRTRWARAAAALACTYLVAVNLFQTVQYNRGIIHYNDMNRSYYSRVYLNPSPGPEDMSLLDGADILAGEESRYRRVQLALAGAKPLQFSGGGSELLTELDVAAVQRNSCLKIEAHIEAPGHTWGSRLKAVLQGSDADREISVRLNNPVGERSGRYAFYLCLPDDFRGGRLQVLLSAEGDFAGQLRELRVLRLEEGPAR